MTRVEELIEEVRTLPPEEQEVVREALNSDAERLELSPEWREEIRLRIEDLDSGGASTVSWEEVRDRLRERIRTHTD